MEFTIRHLIQSDRDWVITLLRERWGSTQIVTRGRIHHADVLPALVAEREGERCGLLTYHIALDECEVISLDSFIERQGVASALLGAVQNGARRAGCNRLWLITTNDNTHAIDFYKRWGFTLVVVHRGAIERSRELKPEIPTHGAEGIAVEDEWEFECRL